MLFWLTFRLISATTAFLYPGYASYKTLSQRPASEAELERWLMYWSVLGCIVAVEYVAEWLVSWLPLYYPLKTLFLLYLALPQTAGSAYLYQMHLRPFFAAHEKEIDSALAQSKVYIYTALQRLLRRAWEHVSGTVAQMQSQPSGLVAGESPLEEEAATHTGAPPTLNDPVSGPAQLVAGLWSTYGPGLLASGAALLRQAQASAAQAAANASAQTSSARRQSGTSERRRQLEAELASLPSEPAPYDVSSATSSPVFESVPRPSADRPSRNSSEGSLRERSSSGNGKSAFEEVEVPSDMEGEGTGQPVPKVPEAARRSSWFGWGAGASGHEKAKND
ncbi:TB2/DP1, HVA22 family-domain-containing protein [Trametes punicea]|nr:TB2/DP1, HVA22 family-domain-containing protein [Trametes punicea]